MELRGIAFKFVPQRQPQYYANLNERSMVANLMTDVKTASKTPSYGYLWRGFQDTSTYFDEDVRRLVSNYRNAFLALAVYYTNVANQPEKATASLDRMDQLLPRQNFPMEPRFKIDVVGFYGLTRDTVKSRKYVRELIAELEPIVAKRQKEQISYYSNYIMLFTCYLGMNMYDKASELVNILKQVYAGEPGVDGFVAQLTGQIEAKRKAQASENAARDSVGQGREGK
jgi:hypothetical protein